MATIPYTITPITRYREECHLITWPALTNSTTDVGDAIQMPGSYGRSVQVTGTLGTGGSVQIQGSNIVAPSQAFASTDFVALTDPQGNALDMNSLKIEEVQEITYWIRPKITAGDGSTSLTVSLLVRRPPP